MTVRLGLVVAAVVIAAAGTPAQRPPLKSGIDVTSIDSAVRPQDDLYRHVNGGWLARTSIPPDRVTFSTAAELEARTAADLRAIIEDIAAEPNLPKGSPEQQIADLYRSLMDEKWIEALGVKPIQDGLDRINAISRTSEFAAEAGHLGSIGTGGPFEASLAYNPAEPRIPAVTLMQSGIMLPDRDFYLAEKNEAYATIRAEYEKYLTRIFTLIDRPTPSADAAAMVALESKLAEAQWPRAASRDPLKTSNRYTLAQLAEEMPGFDWKAWAKPQGIDKIRILVIAQPSFFERFSELVASEPLEVWKAWLLARYVTASAPFLSRDFADARFDFFGRVLTGQEAWIPRWRRGVSLVNGYLGDSLGRRYVDRYFPASSKARVDRIVDNLLSAYRRAILRLDWMSEPTKEEALLKLSTLDTKIGFPQRWRSYRGLEIRRDDLVGNIERAKRFETSYRSRSIGGTPAGGWMITPQTVNAYYSPVAHEIVVPAAILQPPFFDPEADDAVNYGAIGAVIGHEIGHSLDDRGRHFDGSGQIRDWWTAKDDAEYRRRTARLVEQFNGYSPIDGVTVNGQLTLGENFGDLGGLMIAYRAWQISRRGQPAPVIDGYTGDQRFFMGWAQIWRSKLREEYLPQFLLSSPHPPSEFRTNGPVSNMPEFYAAFDVQSGDALFVPPDRRIKIW